jgi:hypothetical protein
MTVFIIVKDRQLEISDAYFMALVFVSGYMATKLVMRAIERRENKEQKTNLLFRGGAFTLLETETSNMIIACVKDDVPYVIKDPRLIKLIYRLAGQNFKRHNLIITPNLMRLFALKLANQNSVIVRFQNFLVFSDSPIRLLIRVATALTISIITGICSTIPVAIFALFLAFSQTENCGFPCDKYFQEIRPQDNGALMVYAPKSTGNIIITKEGSAEGLEIFIPDETQVRPNPIINKVQGKTTTDRRYARLKTRPVAKEMKYSDFIKQDPVLKALSGLKEPNVPTKQCPFTPDQIRDHI